MEKHEQLELEALDDLKWGHSNKAASALYFSLHQLSCHLLSVMGERIPRRDDKLANAVENKGLATAARALRMLYELRKKADYSSQNVELREVRALLPIYKEAKKELLRSLGEADSTGGET